MAEWTWDQMSNYRLLKDQVNSFLKGKFGDHDFNLEVSRTLSTQQAATLCEVVTNLPPSSWRMTTTAFASRVF